MDCFYAAVEMRENPSLRYQYTDLVEPLSLDEAFLDVSESEHCRGSATLIAKEIRSRIFAMERLNASAGIAPNKFLAKVASDWEKPNGQFVIRPDEIDAFVKQLPVKRIFGVGKVTEKKLLDLGVENCLDLQAFSEEKLAEHFGVFGKRLYELSRGIDNRPVTTHRTPKSGTSPSEAGFTHLCEQAWQRGKRPVRLIGLGVQFFPLNSPEQLELSFSNKESTPSDRSSS